MLATIQNVVLISAMAKEKGAAQFSLNWVQSQGIDVCPIPGTTSIAHLSDNVAAMKVAMLSQEECNVVAALVPKEEVHGNRYAGNDTKRGTYLCARCGDRLGTINDMYNLDVLST